MPVNTTHSEYDQHLPIWTSTRDACTGQAAIKAKTTVYLPEHIPADKQRYAQYLQRALYVNIAGRTLNGLTGMIFRKEPEIVVPADLEIVQEDADGLGNSLSQLARVIATEVLQTGRCGVLIDYPPAAPGASLEDTAGQRAVVALYPAESIINWQTVAGRVTQIVLQENIKEPGRDEFEQNDATQYRVLSIDESGNYIVRLFDQNGNLKEEPVTPRDFSGSPWREIPFVFIGATSNTPKCDKPPLYDLAQVNIGHYRNSADYEEGVYIHGQGTLFLSSEMSAEQFNAANPNGILVGARRGHFLGAGGSAVLLQMQPNTAAREAMLDKESQMLAIGAKLIQPASGNETVDGARMRASSEVSVLHTICGNIAEGLERAMRYVCAFMGGDPEEVEIDLNREFFDATMNPQEVMALIQLADRGDIAQSDIRARLRKTGWIGEDRTDAELDSESENFGPVLNA